ncbi:alcohol dehydrogenase class IV [Bradyrhizobium sp. R2.2-H]|jgi:alcohol dehydrogenase class IV|uniref:iron-containing alcohol dehydrogenase n=1 Tax=unclassified Bradyrhizobium TaxID=2631580 RepID=UPI00104CE13D|nr:MULTISPECIES: iron-containing alcohol dehydrogenase [unclassified Bradyrhizobium]TCU60281.1 alcohol dehydrogenase class IV [Bradyrhizobium sp. Y-H1]TCU63923.1 alcohol dehydrogenase class IV [Bradyrhizobium sp. R2.2-H]
MSTIGYLTTTIFDHGAIKSLPTELAALGIRRPLLVTDAGVQRAGIAAQVLAHLDPTTVAIFDGTPPNPTEEAVLEGVVSYREGGCDGVIALGGGSPIDLAKGVALAATHEGPLEQYAAVLGGIGKITDKVAPVIAIPTTAGTGSEVGRGALINLTNGSKLALISPHLIPKRAICDPELTLGLPPVLTAATGIDALTHCIETFLSPLVNPPAEAIALDGAKRAWHFIQRAVTNGADREARWEMMMAALEGGLTFQKGLGAVHSLSHAAGALRSPTLHHGMLNGVFLPHILRFSENMVGNKYETLKDVFCISRETDLAAAVSDLVQSLKLPVTLGQMGFEARHIPQTVVRALADHSNATAPRKASAEEFEGLLRAAL